jgi:integrative and conjugative element protein (TIGR02256 family)
MLVLPARIWADVVMEADQRAPSETGGILLGRWCSSEEAVVEYAVGPGPRAVHRRDYFQPDHDFHDVEIARLYRKSPGLEYLGDWHTHPGGPAYLSLLDMQTLERIAREESARAPKPVMLILAHGRPWTVSAWCMQKRPGARRYEAFAAYPLGVRSVA